MAICSGAYRLVMGTYICGSARLDWRKTEVTLAGVVKELLAEIKEAVSIKSA